MSVLISHNEKFPSRGHHVTFVQSVRPMSAVLLAASPNEEAARDDIELLSTRIKVTLSIFVPDYVPPNTRVFITLNVQKKPELGGSEKSGKNSNILGKKSFYFSIMNLPLKTIDIFPPRCMTKFACSTIQEDCKAVLAGKFKCDEASWMAEVLINDNITGLRQVIDTGYPEENIGEEKMPLRIETILFKYWMILEYLAGLFEYVCAQSQNRSSERYLFSFENIQNSPPNPSISSSRFDNRIQMTTPIVFNSMTQLILNSGLLMKLSGLRLYTML